MVWLSISWLRSLVAVSSTGAAPVTSTVALTDPVCIVKSICCRCCTLSVNGCPAARANPSAITTTRYVPICTGLIAHSPALLLFVR